MGRQFGITPRAVRREFDERELGAICLAVVVALIPAILVSSVVFLWLVLIG